MNFKYFLSIVISFVVLDSCAIASNSDTLKTKSQGFSPSFYTNPLTNPAYTGIFGGQNITIEAGIDKPLKTYGNLYRPQSYSFLYDLSVGKKRNLSFGINLSDTKGGAWEKTSLGFSVSKNFSLFASGVNSWFHKLRIGLTTEYDQLLFNNNGWIFGDMIDPQYGFIYYTKETRPSETSKGFLNFSAGMWYYNPYFYFGFSALNVTEPNCGYFSVAKIPMEINISTGGNVFLNNNFSVHPSINISILPGFNEKFNSYSPTLICTYKQKYDAGLSFMDLNKIGFHAGCTVAGHFILLATCAFSTNTDLYQLGTLGYLGGKIMYHFNN
jgi:type IX secretion system PorP/SprF family membrane protein